MKKSEVAVVACPDYEPAHVKESLPKGLEEQLGRAWNL